MSTVYRRVALYLQDAHPPREGMEIVQYAEDRGFEAVWQAESRLVRECTIPLAAYAAATKRIKVGSGVISMWTRNPAFIAQTFYTLDDLAPGRVLLGIGAWWEPLASKVGVKREKPLQVMREVVEVVRRLLRMETVTLKGEYVNVHDIRIDPIYGGDRPRNIPIYIGATGRKMLELAGEIGDGVLLNYLVSESYNAEAMEALARGAAKAGRKVEDIDRPQLVVCSLDKNRERALDNARKMVTLYLGQQPHIMKASGASQDLVDEVNRIVGWPADEKKLLDAKHLVTDDIVQRVAAAGAAEECRAKVRQYCEAGCTCPVLYPLGENPREMIDAFADGF
ncbi:MAG: LLM class flavin-dependent oxidoreductase [Candidatus Tectomicrobia bacterium]|nr:LLM class flavin-dependent oxidoreductase [Candidatus Tectomicrobia bacterium]